jgi:hypothetical protein
VIAAARPFGPEPTTIASQASGMSFSSNDSGVR